MTRNASAFGRAWPLLAVVLLTLALTGVAFVVGVQP